MAETLTALFLPLWLLLFLVMWFGMIWLIAKMGSWQTLAKVYGIEKYPARPRQNGGLQTILLNRSRYKNSVTVAFDEDGIYLHPIIFFRFKHDLLYIPWEDITVHPKSASRSLFGFDFTRRLTFAKVPDVRVVFMKRLIEKFERYRSVRMMGS
ncbi:MAG: hypothetical protein AAGN15_23295 [Cyanobacteria bacterium J06581_3]